MFEIQSSRLPLRRLALELMYLRDLAQAVRQSSHRAPAVQRALDKLPKLTDRQAWDRLSAEERAEAGFDFQENM